MEGTERNPREELYSSRMGWVEQRLDWGSESGRPPDSDSVE